MDTVAAARAGDEEAFERLVAEHRRELHAHCYRMLGSVVDAEDALQETMVAAWRGLASFEGRSSLRSWLYRIATNCCLRLASKRPPRMLSWDHGPALGAFDDLGDPVTGPVFLEPLPDRLTTPGPAGAALATNPQDWYGTKESVELAYVAALQHLPANQRAVLILREVLAFSAAEVAGMLDTSVASVNSALQRARVTLAERLPDRTQKVERLTADEQRVVERFSEAWERADVDALVQLLAEDVRFTMPPLPAWFDGTEAVAGFFRERVFETPWRLLPMDVNGQPGFACYQASPDDGTFRLGAVTTLSFRDGRVTWIAGFVDPDLLARVGLPAGL
jgi:RNA polymerase sigma-70 factor (TIGR02960 family)